MQDIGTAIVVTLLTWWFSTGAILFLDGLPRWTFRWSMAGAALLAAGSLFAVHRLATEVSVAGAYGGFAAAIFIWGFVEIAFLLGLVTGSWRQDCPAGLRGLARFKVAARTVSHHELMLVAALCAIAAVSWGQPNQTALWTFAVLWLMRLSTKLNIFFGVPNITVEFLPDHLAYLKSFFRLRAMNLLFPVSVTAGTAATVALAAASLHVPSGGYASVSFILLATLTALGVIEHWFLVVPLDVAQLWSWSLRSHGRTDQPNSAAAPVRDNAAIPADLPAFPEAAETRTSLNWTRPIPCVVGKP